MSGRLSMWGRRGLLALAVAASVSVPGWASTGEPQPAKLEPTEAASVEATPAEATPAEATSAEATSTEAAALDPLGQGLVVKVADSLPEHELVRGWIEDRGYAALGRSGRALVGSDLIRVAVKGGPFDYRISLQVRRNGNDLAEQPEPLVCACGSDEMLKLVGQAIGAAAEQLAVAVEAEREAERAAVAARSEAECRQREDEAVSAAVKAANEQRRYRPTALGAGGLVSLGLGAGLFAGGLGLTEQVPGSAALWSGGAKAMVGIGSVALLGGLTMLVVDVARCKRGSDRCRRVRAGKAAWLRGAAWAGAMRGGRG